MSSCIGIWIDLQQRQPCRTEPSGGNLIPRIRVENCFGMEGISRSRIWHLMAGEWIKRYRIAGQVSTVVADFLSGCRHMSGERYATIFVAPLLGPQKVDLVFPNWPTKVTTIVVVLQFAFGRPGFVKEKI